MSVFYEQINNDDDDNSKTNDPKVFKLGVENDLGIPYKWYCFGVQRPFRPKVKVTGSVGLSSFLQRLAY